MALVAVANGQTMVGSQAQQLIDLLTGVMTDQPVTLRMAAGSPLLLDRSDAAGIKGLLAGQRSAATRWFLGLDASDQFALLNAAGTQNNFGVTDLGAGTFRAGLAIAGPLSGVTSLAMAGALSGVTTLGMSGALSGATTGAFSGDVTLGSRLVMSPATAKLLLGSSGGGFRDSADTIDLLLLDAVGLATYRNAMKIPPVAGGTVAPTSYGSTLVKIDEKTPTTGTSVSFTSIPQGFRHLMVEYTCRTDHAAVTLDFLLWQMNNFTDAKYDSQEIQATQAAVSTAEQLGATAGRCGITAAAAAATNWYARGRIDFPGYADAFAKQCIWETSGIYNSTAGTIQMYQGVSGYNNSTAAISRLDLLVNVGNFLTGTVFTLYGIP